MKYHIVTFGCQMNTADSQRIAALLDGKNYERAENLEGANLVIVNMCSVRQPAVDRVFGVIEKIRKQNKKVTTVLTGCILKKDRKKFEKIFDYVLNMEGIARQISFLSAGVGSPEREDLPPKKTCLPSKNQAGFVNIMTGCNNFCSYCVVPYTRGREVCRPANEIINEVEKLVKQGCKNITLLGQNVNSYKSQLCDDDRTHKVILFPELLKIINNIPGDFKLSFLTSHPKDLSDELIKAMARCQKFSKQLNLPIQSGDDQILRKMNRPYTVAKYKKLVKKIRKAVADISLTTDVIVGFPGETEKQFQNTVKTFKEIGFDMAFINKYSPREGTAAAKMQDNVPWSEKKRREKILINLINAR